jgi:acyl-CoA thioesterase-1
MISLLWFCAAGYCFFLGAVLLFISGLLSIFPKSVTRWFLILFPGVIGMLLIYLSSIALPIWLYAAWFTAGVAWALSLKLKRTNSKIRLLIILLYLSITVTAVTMETEYLKKPKLQGENFEKLWIIGDSVSAGIGDQNEITWPKILNKKYNIDVSNLAVAGATVTTALIQADSIDNANGLVLIEIGGNDLFEKTPINIFYENYDKLLAKVYKTNTNILMIELPLLPGQMKYGRVQRKLAKKYSVSMIPKRFFAKVLSTKGASNDIAHLTSLGHNLMADMVWKVTEQGFKTKHSAK